MESIMLDKMAVTEHQMNLLNEIKELPDELVLNLLQIVKIIKKTIKYQFDAEEKPIILGQFQSLIQDWEAPGMEVYDDL